MGTFISQDSEVVEVNKLACLRRQKSTTIEEAPSISVSEFTLEFFASS